MKDLFDNVAAQNIINFIQKNPIFIALYDVDNTKP